MRVGEMSTFLTSSNTSKRFASLNQRVGQEFSKEPLVPVAMVRFYSYKINIRRMFTVTPGQELSWGDMKQRKNPIRGASKPFTKRSHLSRYQISLRLALLWNRLARWSIAKDLLAFPGYGDAEPSPKRLFIGRSVWRDRNVFDAHIVGHLRRVCRERVGSFSLCSAIPSQIVDFAAGELLSMGMFPRTLQIHQISRSFIPVLTGDMYG